MNKINRWLIEEDIFKCIIPLSPEAAVQVTGEVTDQTTDQVTDQGAGEVAGEVTGEVRRGNHPWSQKAACSYERRDDTRGNPGEIGTEGWKALPRKLPISRRGTQLDRDDHSGQTPKRYWCLHSWQKAWNKNHKDWEKIKCFKNENLTRCFVLMATIS